MTSIYYNTRAGWFNIIEDSKDFFVGYSYRYKDWNEFTAINRSESDWTYIKGLKVLELW